MDFSFLQADNIGLMLLNNCLKLMRTGAQAVDIKRDEFHKSLPWLLFNVAGC
jgi:hypothetical protein